MTAYTSVAAGNWSSSATWTPAGVPGAGDTVTLAHIVTFDLPTRDIGTSPNDNTTLALTRTAAGQLKFLPNCKLTCRGNFGGAHGSKLDIGGGQLVFDASMSGGTPVYRMINGGGEYLVATTATALVRGSISAPAGYTWAMAAAMQIDVGHVDFRRCSLIGSSNGAFAAWRMDNCLFDGCNTVDISFGSATLSFSFTNNRIRNTTHATDSLKISTAVNANAGVVRKIVGNSADKAFNDLCRDKEYHHNRWGGYTSYPAPTTSFQGQVYDIAIDNSLNLNGGDGTRIYGSYDGIYVTHGGANPHFLNPRATNGVDETISRAVFEGYGPDTLDTGDCIIVQAAACSAGKIINVANAIVLRNSAAGSNGVTSGQLITSYAAPATNSTHNVAVSHCTMNQSNPAGTGGRRACIAASEAPNPSGPDQVSALRSNIGWSHDAANQTQFAERVSGTVKGHITPAGVIKNWLWNLAAGNNQRSFNDHVNSPAQTMWASGDAMAANVGADMQTGDPQFFDPTRCLRTWAIARGYGTTHADGWQALGDDPYRITDLLAWIFDGFKVCNPAARAAGHDGLAIGAANFHNPARNTAALTALRADLAQRYGIAA